MPQNRFVPIRVLFLETPFSARPIYLSFDKIISAFNLRSSMLCHNTMEDELLGVARPRRISISTQRAISSPIMFLNAVKKKSLDEVSTFLVNPEFNINAAHDNITGIKLALDIEWVEGIHYLLARPSLTLESVPHLLHKLCSILPTTPELQQLYTECFDLAIARKSDVNKSDAKGKKPLHHAVKQHNTLAVESLLKNNAKITYSDYDGLNPCVYLIEGNLDSFADIFFKYNKHLLTKTTSVAIAKYSPSVGLLSAILPELEDKVKERLFISAIENGRLSQIKYFFENRISMTTIRNLDGKHILYIAAANGHFKVLSYLLQQNLILPRTEWENSVLFYLLNCTATNPQDENELDKLFKKLLKGKDVNSKNTQGETVLHQACFKGQINAINMLLASGARIDVQQCGGDTPLHYALRTRNSLQVLETLAKGVSKEALLTALFAAGVEGTCLQMAEKYQLADVINFIQSLL